MNFTADLPKNVLVGLHQLVSEKTGFCRLLNFRPDAILSMYPKEAFDHTKLVSTFFKDGAIIPDGLIDILNNIHNQPRNLRLPSTEMKAEEVLFGYSILKNPLFRLIFQALAYSEWQFCNKDLPQKSHEERLTGHVLSKFYSSLDFCESAIENFAYEIHNKRLLVDFAYHDLSTSNREKVTGADFGVILHVNLPDMPEVVGCYSFQAKKFRQKTISLDIDQLKTQVDFVGEEYAYTVFYDCSDENKRFAPAVLSTQLLLEYMKENDKKSVGIDIVVNNGKPLSLFLLMEAEEMRSPLRNLIQAKNLLIGGFRRNRLFDSEDVNFEHSRVLTLSIGGVGLEQEFRRTQDLFSQRETSDGE